MLKLGTLFKNKTMQIKFHGHSSLSIKDDDFTITTDPYDDSTGLKPPALTANVVIVSYNDAHHNNASAVQGEPKVFNWPGEYETGGVHFKGISSFHNAKEDAEQKENTIFTMDFKGIHLCHLGALGTKLTPEQLEEIGDVDILFVPVGSKESIDAKKATEMYPVSQVTGIPMDTLYEGHKEVKGDKVSPKVRFAPWLQKPF